jgi:putative transposase
MPRMNAVMERWLRTCRRALLDRTLICNQRHLLHALREYEIFYNTHRPHQGINNARPLAPLPEPITNPNRLALYGAKTGARLVSNRPFERCSTPAQGPQGELTNRPPVHTTI